MKTALPLTIVLLFSVFSGASIASGPVACCAWQYKLVQADFGRDADKQQKRMNELGDDGWELAGVVPRRSETGPDTLLFKRMKSSDGPSETDATTVRGSKNQAKKITDNLGGSKNRPQTEAGVEITVHPETGIIAVRGGKEAVERTTKVIEQIRQGSPQDKWEGSGERSRRVPGDR